MEDLLKITITSCAPSIVVVVVREKHYIIFIYIKHVRCRSHMNVCMYMCNYKASLIIIYYAARRHGLCAAANYVALNVLFCFFFNVLVLLPKRKKKVCHIDKNILRCRFLCFLINHFNLTQSQVWFARC